MVIKATVRINKANHKKNLTYSISNYQDGSFRSVNFTGSLVACSGFVTSDKVNLDQQVLEANVGTTLLITDNKLGAQIAKTAQKIYADRATQGDKNPTIELNFHADSFSITATNILAKGISNVEINANATLVDDSAKALEMLAQAKEHKQRTAAGAAKAALGGLSKFVKTIV